MLWVSSFGVLAEGFKMPPSGFSNGRKLACHWPMCSWEVLLLKSEGAASSRHTILRKKHCFECPISKFWLRALKWPRPASQMVENGHVIGRCAHERFCCFQMIENGQVTGRCAHGRFCCPNLWVHHPEGAASCACSILWVYHPQGAASCGCTILRMQHPVGAPSSWCSILSIPRGIHF